MGRVEREGREGSEGQNRKKEEREGGSGTEDEVQGVRSGLVYMCRGPPNS